MNESLRRQLETALSVILLMIVLTGAAAAEEPAARPGMVGLAASWQSGQTDILFPIWASDRLVVTPSLSIVHVTDFATDVGFAMAVRFVRGGGSARPYFGGRLGAMHRSPDEGESLTDYLAGGMLGGECFLHEHLSVGVEAQVNAVFSDEHSYRYGNPNGINVNTAAAVVAAFYF